MLLVHVTWFNRLMWDNGATPTRIIEHGVVVPDDVRYTGTLDRGLVVINNLATRGRLLGLDIFEAVRRRVPLDLVGMDAESAGGLGEISHADLPAFMSRYRFLFNPIRYTSLGLAVCEAMTVGLPVVGLATTEMATAVVNGVSGYADTNLDRLVERMHVLLRRPQEARRLGEGARRIARARFGIGRFAAEWDGTLRRMAAAGPGRPVSADSGRPLETASPPGGL
jgi:glycosyltransferase involved in cell wall biosynthesis